MMSLNCLFCHTNSPKHKNIKFFSYKKLEQANFDSVTQQMSLINKEFINELFHY